MLIAMVVALAGLPVVAAADTEIPTFDKGGMYIGPVRDGAGTLSPAAKGW